MHSPTVIYKLGNVNEFSIISTCLEEINEWAT